jgi:hypothetical protein
MWGWKLSRGHFLQRRLRVVLSLENFPAGQCKDKDFDPDQCFVGEQLSLFMGYMTGIECLHALSDEPYHGEPTHCAGGEYVKNKGSASEACMHCPAGTFSQDKTTRNRRCKKCPLDSFQPHIGANYCQKCPQGFSTFGQRGKKQCHQPDAVNAFKKGKSMKDLQVDPFSLASFKDDNEEQSSELEGKGEGKV